MYRVADLALSTKLLTPQLTASVTILRITLQIKRCNFSHKSRIHYMSLSCSMLHARILYRSEQFTILHLVLLDVCRFGVTLYLFDLLVSLDVFSKCLEFKCLVLEKAKMDMIFVLFTYTLCWNTTSVTYFMLVQMYFHIKILIWGICYPRPGRTFITILSFDKR